MRRRRLAFVAGSLVLVLIIAFATLSSVRQPPVKASIGVHSYDRHADGIAASLLMTNVGEASIAVPLRFSCHVQKVSGSTNYVVDTPYSVFLRPGDYVVLSNALSHVRLPADARAWMVTVQIRQMSRRERLVNAVRQSGVASPRMLSRLAGQPSKESDYQWIECGSSLLEIPGFPTGLDESHKDK